MSEKTANHPHPPAKQPVVDADNTMAIASLILGVLSITGFGLLTGIPAIILGVIALKRPGGRGFSITGIITGAIATVLSILGIVFLIALILFAASSAQNAEHMPLPTPETNWFNGAKT